MGLKINSCNSFGLHVVSGRARYGHLLKFIWSVGSLLSYPREHLPYDHDKLKEALIKSEGVFVLARGAWR